MSKPMENISNPDSTAEQRKADHIELAFQSQVLSNQIDNRFYYEPMLKGHPQDADTLSLDFLGKKMKAPLWVSSMTGGTDYAKIINHNLAKACGEYGMGMGLGSCRQLLFSDEFLKDFQVRSLIGDAPLYANLGIAQLEELVNTNQLDEVKELVNKLEADGLIIHVNPMQEALQPEGDVIKTSPLETIKRIIDTDLSIIVKEVGQGFGPESMKALLELPIEAIDFAASGGTNFAILELFRASEVELEAYEPLARIGHSAEEMVACYNKIASAKNNKIACKQVIISGGVKTFLDGYYLTQKIQASSVYGQASAFLKHARGSYEELQAHVERQINGLKLANQFLKVK